MFVLPQRGQRDLVKNPKTRSGSDVTAAGWTSGAGGSMIAAGFDFAFLDDFFFAIVESLRKNGRGVFLRFLNYSVELPKTSSRRLPDVTIHL